MADYSLTFDTGLYDITKMGDPAPIPSGQNAAGRGGQFSLSAANNSVQLLLAGKIDGKDVVGLMFNLSGDILAPNAPVTSRQVNSPDGGGHHSNIRIHPAYNGQTFALVNTDGMTVTYTAAQGTMSVVASGQDLAVDPNTRRLVQLGYR
tara:strand:- start:86 stop:532 length:447 start_codon:yes stop_codon:yes gene_type:complete